MASGKGMGASLSGGNPRAWRRRASTSAGGAVTYQAPFSWEISWAASGGGAGWPGWGTAGATPSGGRTTGTPSLPVTRRSMRARSPGAMRGGSARTARARA